MKRALLVLLALGAVPGSAAGRAAHPLALVTAETDNQLLAVDVRSGHVVRRLALPADPENVEAYAGDAAVVSTKAGVVTRLDPRTLKVRQVIRGFASPHIAAYAPSGDYLFVTDDARGQVASIQLGSRSVRKVFVGYGAHHLAFSPDQRRLLIALGERARSIAVVDTHNPLRPRLEGNFDPRGLAHDLAFTPDGRFIWVTYDDRPYLKIFSARSLQPVGALYAGPPPAHIRFDDAYGLAPYGNRAYVTSGNASALRIFDWRRRRLLRLLRTAPGSYNLAIDHGLIATSSLTAGTVTIVRGGHRALSERVAPAARDVALVP
jgi:DNA-binding beta-propeller fold protein YncE